MNIKKRWNLLFLLLIATIFFGGCSLVYYNPLTSGGDQYDINTIKAVIDWLKYYVEGESILGVESLIYPYSPHYNAIKRRYETFFSSCNNIKWDYDIIDISFKQEGEAVVIGEEAYESSCEKVRAELYIIMKQTDNGTWYIYDIQDLLPDEEMEGGL